MLLYNNKNPDLKIINIWNVSFSFLILKQLFYLTLYQRERCDFENKVNIINTHSHILQQINLEYTS